MPCFSKGSPEQKVHKYIVITENVKWRSVFGVKQLPNEIARNPFYIVCIDTENEVTIALKADNSLIATLKINSRF